MCIMNYEYLTAKLLDNVTTLTLMKVISSVID